MSDTTTPTAGPTPPASPPTLWQRLSRWSLIVAGIVLALAGAAKVIGSFTLPSCESRTVADTLRSIFKGRDIAIDSISDLKTVSSSSSENTCTARIEAPGERANINYRVYWNGWTAQVMITEVKSQPR